MARNETTFHAVSELPHAIRFLVCCGPLQNLDLAGEALADMLDVTLRPRSHQSMPTARFDALEWAAKKGNPSVVEWSARTSSASYAQAHRLAGALHRARRMREAARPARCGPIGDQRRPLGWAAALAGRRSEWAARCDEVARRRGRCGSSHQGRAWPRCCRSHQDTEELGGRPGHVACLSWVQKRLAATKQKATSQDVAGGVGGGAANPIGSIVKIEGLQSKPELNGATGPAVEGRSVGALRSARHGAP